VVWWKSGRVGVWECGSECSIECASAVVNERASVRAHVRTCVREQASKSLRVGGSADGGMSEWKGGMVEEW